ncbi:hypothetical protein BJP36_38685 [Moorena producens JHB]|uniref:Uncharacterized protein n=1 Tax=Moorena producens (strain JHB) TaxID=1454205 RepID=A0A9Q9SUN7_MOOP1|nr:hypothetical protein [Moorena producens]WAN70001.1 hypothetical protein BJP36_38685 [Moorena producens JHB]
MRYSLDGAHPYSLLPLFSSLFPLFSSLFPVPCSLKSRNCVLHKS